MTVPSGGPGVASAGSGKVATFPRRARTRGVVDDDPDHVGGVRSRGINTVFERVSYPVTADGVVAEHGDLEVERTNAEPIAVRELFEPTEDDVYGSTDGLRQNILTLMPEESVGRQRYSDRGPTVDVPGKDRQQDRPLPGHDRGEERT